MAVEKDEFLSWRDHPVTKELVADINKVVEEAASDLISSKESNPQRDQYLKGFIRGVLSTYEWVPEIDGGMEDEA